MPLRVSLACWINPSFGNIRLVCRRKTGTSLDHDWVPLLPRLRPLDGFKSDVVHHGVRFRSVLLGDPEGRIRVEPVELQLVKSLSGNWFLGHSGSLSLVSSIDAG